MGIHIARSALEVNGSAINLLGQKKVQHHSFICNNSCYFAGLGWKLFVCSSLCSENLELIISLCESSASGSALENFS